MLGRLQREIEAIYGVEVPHRVEDYVVDDETRALIRPRSTAPEELLVIEEPDGVTLGLYVDAEVCLRLESVDLDAPDASLLHRDLPAFTTALEGVSHFVYVAHRAGRDQGVSLLELEAQAEVDKFVTVLLKLWHGGHKDACEILRHRLFHAVRYREDLDGEALTRYRDANALAGAYCRSLEDRFLDDGTPEDLLREVRTLYHLGAGEKFSFMRRLH
jgi:hypothetical protein